MNVLIKSARIIDSNSKHHNTICDVFVKNGKIDKIAKRTAMKLRAAEPERVQKFRASQQATDK